MSEVPETVGGLVIPHQQIQRPKIYIPSVTIARNVGGIEKYSVDACVVTGAEAGEILGKRR